MSTLAVALVAVSLVFDVSGQLLFKTGLNRLARHEGATIDLGFWVALSRSPWLAAEIGRASCRERV